MHRLLVFVLLVAGPCWGQKGGSLLGLDLRVGSEGKHVQFSITPESFEPVANYLETHLIQPFFIEDNQGARYKGTVTHMGIALTPKRVLFSGILDQPLSSLDPDMKVYLSIR